MGIGDYVIIINSGNIFTTYEEMFELFRFKNIKENDIPDNLNKKTIFKIFNVDESNTMFAIENSKHQILIGAEGIKLYKNGNNLLGWKKLMENDQGYKNKFKYVKEI